MREIKFRVWEVARLMNGELRNTMISNERLLQWGEIPSPMLPNGFDYEPLGEGEQWVWMQYTGLKDKNGKEIYEGDIVRQGANFPSVIEWCQKDDGIEGTGWMLHETSPKNKKYHRFYVTTAFTDGLEVIGNIYENPELMEGKNGLAG